MEEHRSGPEGERWLRASTELRPFGTGARFLAWLDAIMDNPHGDLRERVEGRCLRDLARQRPDGTPHWRCAGAKNLGLHHIGGLLAAVANRVDRLRATPQTSWHAEIAAGFGSGAGFSSWCADVCAQAYDLTDVELELLSARIRGGSVKAAARLLGKGGKSVANYSTPMFAKMQMTRFAELPAAIARAIDLLAARGAEPETASPQRGESVFAVLTSDRDVGHVADHEVGHDVELDPGCLGVRTEGHVLAHAHAVHEGPSVGAVADRLPDAAVHE
jgi:DNA-binding CsgD family transcriptional regulator